MIGGEAPLIFNYSHDGEGGWSTMLFTGRSSGHHHHIIPIVES
jgi:hypothetical protein